MGNLPAPCAEDLLVRHPLADGVGHVQVFPVPRAAPLAQEQAAEAGNQLFGFQTAALDGAHVLGTEGIRQVGGPEKVDDLADPGGFAHDRQGGSNHREGGTGFGGDDLPVTVKDGDGRAGPGVGIGQGDRHRS